jgi:3-methyladenine DNA glycosylase/8-oxoguanine DNA glycosylase
VSDSPPAASATIDSSVRLDLAGTLAPLAHGRADPTIRIADREAWRAAWTPSGPATVQVLLDPPRGVITARAWGAGAEWALASVRGLVGLEDQPERFHPQHPLLADLARRFAGLRLTHSRDPYTALVAAVIEQKVTGVEARRSYRALLARHGEDAPGPGTLRLLPPPERLAALPYYALHPLGIERRRAETLRRVARLAASGRLVPEEPETLRARLATVEGVGSWTIAEVLRVALGDPDAVSVGDYHVPNVVAWALAGERRADDRRMLELLEPYRGQRGRVQRLLEAAGISPPRRGPRLAPRAIARI